MRSRPAAAAAIPNRFRPTLSRVVAARGIDLAGRRSKPISKVADRRLDYVVSLRDRVREFCPEFPEHPRMVRWSIPEPVSEGDSDEETLVAAFERTADELAERIPFLLDLIEHNPMRR